MTLPTTNIPGTFFLVNSIDPTRTITLRHRFVADMRARFASLLADIKEAVIELDVLALSQEQQRPVLNASGLSTRQFDFPRSDQKVEAFIKWLRGKNQEYLLSSRRKRTGINIFTDQLSSNPTDARESWISTFIDSAYQQGIRRARQELKRKGIEIDDGAFGGDGVQVAFNGPIHADRVGLIYTRAYSSLQGITAEMESVVSDVLAMGIADGKGPREIAKLMDKVITGRGESMAIVDSLGRKIPALRRAEILARTEVIRAHHSANIGEYRAAGLMGIQIQAEHLTAGDARVCKICAPLNGKLYSIEEAEYIIPVHPQCRCVALPYIPEDASPTIDNPSSDPQISQVWSPTMSKKDAKSWGKDSVLKGTYEHVTSTVAANSIKRDGFKLGTEGFGSEFGRGVYLSSNKQSTAFYKEQFTYRGLPGGLTTLKTMIDVRNPYSFDADKALRIGGGRGALASFENSIAGSREKFLQAQDAVQKNNDRLIKKFGWDFEKLKQEGFDPSLRTGAINKLLQDQGYDSIVIKNDNFNEVIGGSQIIVFDPKRVTVLMR